MAPTAPRIRCENVCYLNHDGIVAASERMMRQAIVSLRPWVLFVVRLVAVVGLPGRVLSQTSGVLSREQAAPAPGVAGPRAMLDRYCISCHNSRTKTAGLVLEKDAVDTGD